MNSFDSIAHAMTTISTGGFSTYNLSLAQFNSGKIELISIIFMIIGSLPFVVYLKIIHGDKMSLFRDDQIKLFSLILIILIIITVLWLQQKFNNQELLYLNLHM